MSLRIGANPLGDEGLEVVLDALPGLAELEVGRCGITDKGAQMIYDCLTGPAIVYIQYENKVSEPMLELLRTKFIVS